MFLRLTRGLRAASAAFTSAPNTLIAQLLIVILLGAVTIVGMSNVAEHENEAAVIELTK